MDADNEKRNSAGGIAPAPGDAGCHASGVGGRQSPSPYPPRGGGYLDTCSILNFRARESQKNRDPRLDELHQIGMQRVWLDVAELIGVDNFLGMWRILDTAYQAASDESGRMLVPMRAYRTYLKYQRNRYIDTLTEMGLSASEIREKIRAQLCESISLRHIYRLRKSD